MKRTICLAVALSLLAGGYGCTMSKTQKGAILGGTGGAVIGGIVGKRAGNTAAGAIVGAAVGGATGAVIGKYMDKQAEEMKQVEGANVERVGEGILVTFESGILFDVNKADLRPQAEENLGKMAEILNEYKDTNIRVEGHTDSDGTEPYNQTLSERRAQSVANYLGEHMVAPSRMTVVGFGEMRPVADNTTPEGKQANRRVEVAIVANEELKETAAKEATEG